MLVMVFFLFVFVAPLQRRIKEVGAENTEVEAQIADRLLLATLDLELNQVLMKTYPEVKPYASKSFDEDRLLDLPAQFEALASGLGVTLVSMDSQSEKDGAQVAVETVFQGDMIDLYELLKQIGRVEYVTRLESVSLLALFESEQMKLTFKVPLK